MPIFYAIIGTAMLKATRELYRAVLDMYTNNIKRVQNIRVDNLSEEDTVDTIYALRETALLLDDLRKECSKLQKTIEGYACLLAIRENKVKLTGEYATGTVELKQTYPIPVKRAYDPEKFDELMNYFGVSQPDKEYVRFHWPNVQEYLQEELAAGRNIPVDLNQGINDFRCPVRKKKGILE